MAPGSVLTFGLSYQETTGSSQTLRMTMRMRRGRGVEATGERRMNILWIWMPPVYLSYRR